MKHQQVSVDYWNMGKTMLTYGLLAAMGWLMLRLFNVVFMLPRRLRGHQENMQQTLEDMQRRYPGLNITEEDLKNAEKELEEILKEDKENESLEDKEKNNEKSDHDKESNETPQLEDKKTI